MLLALSYSKPNLARYQERQKNLPASVLKKKSPSPPLTGEPDKKKTCRKDSVEPLDRTSSPLPILPDDLKQKQQQIEAAAQAKSQRLPTPPKEGSPKHRGRVNIQAKPTIAQPQEDLPLEDIRDPLEILRLIRKNPKLGFLYLTPAVDRSSIEYNPYNVK